MPTETRRRTITRRRQNALSKLSNSQREFYINGVNLNEQLDEIAAGGDSDEASDEAITGLSTRTAFDMTLGDSGDVPNINDQSTLSQLGRIDESSSSRRSKISTGSRPRHPIDRREQFRTIKHSKSRRFSTQSIIGMGEVFIENINFVKDSRPVSRLNNIRKFIGKVVNDDRVQAFILTLIMINAVMMGVVTYPVIKYNPAISSKFQLIDQIFLVIFTIELAMQLIYHGWTVFKDSFLVFDLTIIALGWAAEGVKVARTLRIFRALRLITRIDTMRNLVKAVFGVAPNLTGVSMLLSLVFYVFGVLFTQLYKDASKQYPREQQYFVSLPETFFTLFQMMLDGWKKVFLQAYDEYDWSWILFVSFIVVSAFIFANLVIAVICDAVHVLDDEDVAALIGYTDDAVTKERDAAYLAAVKSTNSKDNIDIGTNNILGKSKSLTIQRLREMETQVNNVVEGHNAVMSSLNLLIKESDPGMLNSDSILFSDLDTTERDHSPSKNSGQHQFAVGTDIFSEQESELRSEDNELNNGTTEGNEPSDGIHQSCLSIELQSNIDIGGDSPCSHQNEVHPMKSSNRRLSEINEKFVENMKIVTEAPPFRRLNDARKLVGQIVNDHRVQGFILSLIIINAIMMGVATFPVVKNNPTISSRFQLIDQVFLWAFTIEAAMQVIYHGWTLFKDAFLVFDLTIVALSWAAEGVKVIRSFRILRALRLISRIDTMKHLILAVTSVIPRLTGIMMLLFLVFYVFAVMFTQLFKDVSKQYPRKEQYFVGLPETFFTLFQMMTLDGWRKIYLQAANEYAWSWLPFVSFVVVSAFIFVNLMIAVICDAVHVMGDGEAAGLIGCDKAEIKEMRSADALRSSAGAQVPSIPLRQKLRELQRDIEQVISIQNELVTAISFVARSR